MQFVLEPNIGLYWAELQDLPLMSSDLECFASSKRDFSVFFVLFGNNEDRYYFKLALGVSIIYFFMPGLGSTSDPRSES